MKILYIGLVVFILNWSTWLCPILVYRDWEHKTIKTSDPDGLRKVTYLDSDGTRCGDYYFIPEGAVYGEHNGKWTAYVHHDPFSSFRRDGGTYDWPARYYDTEKEADTYVTRWCKI